MTRSPRRSGAGVGTVADVFDRLLAAGATVIVRGPGGGPEGGHIVDAGPPEHVARDRAAGLGRG
jgi:excinuclease UvrABC ATPase subunit